MVVPGFLDFVPGGLPSSVHGTFTAVVVLAYGAQGILSVVRGFVLLFAVFCQVARLSLLSSVGLSLRVDCAAVGHYPGSLDIAVHVVPILVRVCIFL